MLMDTYYVAGAISFSKPYDTDPIITNSSPKSYDKDLIMAT